MYWVLLSSWFVTALMDKQTEFRECSHVETDIEGNVQNYFCEKDKDCCSTIERPGDCCTPELDKVIPDCQLGPTICAADNGNLIRIEFLNVSVSLKSLLLYLLLGFGVLLTLLLVLYGTYRVVHNSRSSSAQARRLDAYGDEILLEPPPYKSMESPPDYPNDAAIAPSAPLENDYS